MKREIINTGDGSKTIYIPEWNEHYHSKHGAVQEAKHVFLETGLQYYIDTRDANNREPIAILEMGFGTGLNALLTFFKGKELGLSIVYEGVEAFPISAQEIEAMAYGSLLTHTNSDIVYNFLHETSWELANPISD